APLVRQYRGLVVRRIDQCLFKALCQHARAFVFVRRHHDESGSLALDAMHRAGIDFLPGAVAEIDVDRLVEREARGFLCELGDPTLAGRDRLAEVLFAFRQSHRDDGAVDARAPRAVPARNVTTTFLPAAAAGTVHQRFGGPGNAVRGSGPAMNAVTLFSQP